MTPEESKRLQVLAMRYITESLCLWGDIVDIAAALSPKQFDVATKRLAQQTGQGSATLKRKFKAVKYAMEKGCTAEQLKELGQKNTLGMYVNGKVKARGSPLVSFPHKLTPEVRDALTELYVRLGKVCGFKTYDEATEFICADYLTTSDEELIHKSGEGHAEKKTHQARR